MIGLAVIINEYGLITSHLPSVEVSFEQHSLSYALDVEVRIHFPKHRVAPILLLLPVVDVQRPFAGIHPPGAQELERADGVVSDCDSVSCRDVGLPLELKVEPHDVLVSLCVIDDLWALQNAAGLDVAARSVRIHLQRESFVLPVVQVCGGVAMHSVKGQSALVLVFPVHVVLSFMVQQAGAVGIDDLSLRVCP